MLFEVCNLGLRAVSLLFRVESLQFGLVGFSKPPTGDLVRVKGGAWGGGGGILGSGRV